MARLSRLAGSRLVPLGIGFLLAIAGIVAPVAGAEVLFAINDAHVENQPVEGVTLLLAREPGGDAALTARSDERGEARVDLAPGTWWVSYVRAGYVPIGDSETEIRGDGQVVTTTMSMLLEAEGGAARRRVRIVLNWGSRAEQVRDADAHFYCACGAPDAHVYFADMRHERLGHVAELDVDDREWGGPETVTLSDPPPGEYHYWVHQYSRDEETLGRSDIVVRVFFDDRMAGEMRIGPDLTQRTWKPFRHILVHPDSSPELVHFSHEEIARHEDLAPPPDRLSEEGTEGSGEGCALACGVGILGILVVLVSAGLFLRRRRR